MKAAIGKIVSLITENENQNKFEWDDFLLKFSVLAISVYLIAKIDIIIYGYLT